MNYILADQNRDSLLPFTFTRPVANIRVGILTIAEKWEKWLTAEVSYLTEDYLSKKFPIKVAAANVVINPSFLPNQEMVAAINALKENQQLVADGKEIARHTAEVHTGGGFETVEFSGDVLTIEHPWDIFAKNGEALQADFELLTKGRTSQPIPDTNTVISPENIFLEEGAKVSCSILNASTGPIYVGKDAEIMEGCIVRGPLAMCNNSVLKMGAKIYGASTFGPHCKVGGEVSNAVLFAYSNKGHEGFLGNSVLGEWCNLGADTNTSNLKNNYAPVKLWNYQTQGFAQTGLQFCGLMMGDHSKAGINTMFNTGTVVGVCANVFGSGFPRNFIPSYSWGGASGFTTYRTNKAFEAAQVMMARRKVEFDAVEKELLETVFELTQQWRNY
ncbi:GlmU family protein [Croceivirga thetidis]|uniref:Glucose-1-phosphate thymidylyltransferase n=1 Tax=Croceivirga thetidis TaxID=2721623 RepID=A0ABX1GRU6_9FLAO|nr:GlmU family protein [Croceivirga thetidis]NKI32656.1 glucose-1-phosphate thymidylyltransferase [Croceivirga thetidis]